MRVFIWKNGKAHTVVNYNDDLVMAFATGLYVRDTALRLRQQGMDLARAQLSSFNSLNNRNPSVITTRSQDNDPYKYQEQDISWLIR